MLSPVAKEEFPRILGPIDAGGLEIARLRIRPCRAWLGSRSPRARRPRIRSRARRSGGSARAPRRAPRRRRPRSARPAEGPGTPRRSTRSLSAERLITQLEMMTSTEPSGSGMASISPLRNSTLSTSGLALVLAREGQHLVGHVEAIGLAARPDPPGRQQHVDPAAGAEVEHRLAGAELGQRRGIAAAERGGDRRRRERRGLALRVQVRGDRVCRRIAIAAGALGATARRTARSRP